MIYTLKKHQSKNKKYILDYLNLVEFRFFAVLLFLLNFLVQNHISCCLFVVCLNINHKLYFLLYVFLSFYYKYLKVILYL